MKYLIPLLVIVAFIAIPMKSQAQVVKTNLRVTVIDGTGSVVKGAEVQLYSSDADYRKEQNPVTEKVKTDEKGIVIFKDLKPRVYYVLATKGNMNNWDTGQQTDKLKEKKTNRINIIIE